MKEGIRRSVLDSWVDSLHLAIRNITVQLQHNVDNEGRHIESLFQTGLSDFFCLGRYPFYPPVWIFRLKKLKFLLFWRGGGIGKSNKILNI